MMIQHPNIQREEIKGWNAAGEFIYNIQLITNRHNNETRTR